MTKVREIAKAIEEFAPRSLQEAYDNAGLQVGDPESEVSAILLCLDVTPEILEEALSRECNMIVSHHPLIFKGLKDLTGADPVQRVVMETIKKGISIYSAHTNLDSTWDGVSHEMARKLALSEISVLEPLQTDHRSGLGVIGNVTPVPKIEFLRKIKDTFSVEALRYSAQNRSLVVRRVAVCGGAGASLIPTAISRKADIIITGDVKYHDFTTYGHEIIIADIGHFESELCSREILFRIIRGEFQDLDIYFSDTETNPIKIL